MTLKSLLIAFANCLLIAFPQNMIGCGPDIDEYDYHTGFFLRNLPNDMSLRPFYYSNYSFLYDSFEETPAEELLTKEWAEYCGADMPETDISWLVFSTSLPSVKALYAHASGKRKLPTGDSLLKNRMALKLSATADLEALGYLQYAKTVEPYVVGQYDYWEPVVRDSVKMARLIRNGIQLYDAAKKDVFKLKYGYQVVRLAHYSRQYKEAAEYYDRLIAGNPTRSVLQQLSLSLKAGALYHQGKRPEAVYLFSKALSASSVRSLSNYQSFRWAMNGMFDIPAALSYCKNAREKANLIGLMSIYGPQTEFDAMKEVYQLDPGIPILELMAVREVNKMEEFYYTPTLSAQAGGDILYDSWYEPVKTDSLQRMENKLREMGDWFHQVAREKKVQSPALFELAASYVSMMLKEWKQSRDRLDLASTMPMTNRYKDQMAMINLLLLINDPQRIDAEVEKKLLPSLEWLKDKALNGDSFDEAHQSYNKSQWVKFYRSVLAEILARKYHQQNDLLREVLSVGAAEWISNQSANSYWGIVFLRKNMSSPDVAALYAFMKSSRHSAFEEFLLQHNCIQENLVTDFAGTAFLRDEQYAEAVRWFLMTPDANGPIEKDPFIDLLYDQSEKLPANNISTSKLSFAREMLELHKKAERKDKDEAKYLYKIALGLYNTTYYGYAWELVEYSRSGTDGYVIPDDATSFKKNYYGCFQAHDYFKKALDASTDAEFRARCLFMMAKCIQKQYHQPQYREYRYEEYEKYDLASKEYYQKFTNNPYFPQLVKEYGQTDFYREAYQSCSYLRDFISGKK